MSQPSCAVQSFQGVTSVFKGYFWNLLEQNDWQNEKDKECCIVLACIVTWFGILHGWRSLSSSIAWKEASFDLPKMNDSGCQHSRYGMWHVAAWSWTMKICCVVVKCWLVVPQRYRNLGFCSLTTDQLDCSLAASITTLNDL